MNCQADIITLSNIKLKVAFLLYDNGFYDDAFYIGGYSVELLLKAAVCKTLKIDDLFDEKRGWFKKFKYPQSFKIHNIEQLLLLSGNYKELDAELNNPTFKGQWSKVCEWDEESRYYLGRSPQEVKDFLTSVEEISRWIQGRL